MRPKTQENQTNHPASPRLKEDKPYQHSHKQSQHQIGDGDTPQIRRGIKKVCDLNLSCMFEH